MRRAFVVIALLLAPVVRAASPTWITMQNADFRAYSTAGERATRDALNQFERVRGFFLQATGVAPARDKPVCILIFGTEQEYQPFRVNEFAAAYYTTSSDRDFIVIGKLGSASAQLATHEYTHLVFRHGGYTLPPWLNEGLADLFSTLRQTGRDTEFGDILQGRLYELEHATWVPMQTILEADQESPYYNETKQAGSLYNQSWAFVHMLATSDRYRPKFWDVVNAVNGGTPSVKALETVYGVPFAELEAALKSYIRGDNFRKLIVKLKLDSTEHLAAEPANPFDVREVEAEVLMGLRGHQDDARSRFTELSEENPDRPEPWGNLGYLAWRAGNPGEASQLLAKAYKLGSRSPRLLLDLGQLAQQSDPDAAAAALASLLELTPGNVNARLTLAQILLSQKKPAEALEATRPIRSVDTDEQRDHLLFLRARSAMDMGDRATARMLAEKLKSVTNSGAYRSNADALLRAISQP